MTTLGGNPRVRVNASHPEAQAICDRCGVIRNHVDLRWQFEFRGNNLTNTWSLVCFDTCWDRPFELNRPSILPPDPEIVMNARPPQWATQESENPGPHSNDPDPIQQYITGDDVP